MRRHTFIAAVLAQRALAPAAPVVLVRTEQELYSALASQALEIHIVAPIVITAPIDLSESAR